MTFTTCVGLGTSEMFRQMQLLTYILWWRFCNQSYWLLHAGNAAGGREEGESLEGSWWASQKGIQRDRFCWTFVNLLVPYHALCCLACEVFKCTQAMCGFLADVIKAARRWPQQVVPVWSAGMPTVKSLVSYQDSTTTLRSPSTSLSLGNLLLRAHQHSHPMLGAIKLAMQFCQAIVCSESVHDIYGFFLTTCVKHTLHPYT